MKPSIFLKLAAVALLTVVTVTGCATKKPKIVTPIYGSATRVDNTTKPPGGFIDVTTPAKGPLETAGSGLPAGNPQYPNANNLNPRPPGSELLAPPTSNPPVFGPGGIPSSKIEDLDGIPDRGAFAANTIHFDYDKAVVKASELSKLQPVIAALKASPQNKLLIEGHCDERGTEEYNRALGERRALAIRERLAKAGIAPDRLRTVTFGEDKPAELGHTESAWAKNRRGELVLLKPNGL